MLFDKYNKNIWHDSSIDRIVIEYNDIIQNALKKVNICNETKYKGGGTRDINTDWKCVVIQLIDSVCIRIVCDSVVFE